MLCSKGVNPNTGMHRLYVLDQPDMKEAILHRCHVTPILSGDQVTPVDSGRQWLLMPSGILLLPSGRQCHSSGHAMYHRLACHLLWPGMREDIKSYVAACATRHPIARTISTGPIPMTGACDPNRPADPDQSQTPTNQGGAHGDVQTAQIGDVLCRRC